MKKQALFLSLVCTTALLANPSGADVQGGLVSMQAVDKLLEIHASDRSIINWNDFSIQFGETTRFVQPSASSAVLNRVTGMNASMINGMLEANGRVILVNPHGVLIGKDGIIKTAEFIASTTDILNLDDWSIRRDAVQLACEGIDASALINHEGMIEVTGIDRTGGRILLLGPDLKIDGKLVAVGGTIELLGNRVLLDQNADMDVSSAQGGGTVLVGGDFQGKNPDVMNSKFVGMHPDAVIVASALENGNGGKVILWSEEGTDYRGSIFAKGGERGGDGGVIEVSSKGSYIYRGQSDASAPMGNPGTLLLDPADITIGGAVFGTPFAFPVYAPAVNSGILAVADVQAALAGGSNVTIQTSAGVGGTGIINWLVGFPIAWATNNCSLTLQANDTITIASTISSAGNLSNISLQSTGGGITITSGAAAASGVDCTGTGAVTLTAQNNILIAASTLVGGTASVSTTNAPLNITSTAGSITVGDALANDPTTVATTSGALNLTAATGVDVIAGIANTANARVVTGTTVAPINVNVTGAGNVQLISISPAPGFTPTAQIGDDLNPSGPVVINVSNGDLNMLVGSTASPAGLQIVKIGSQDSVNITANNMNVLPSGFGLPRANVIVANAVPTTSSINLSGNFLGTANGNLLGNSSYLFDFSNSTLSFSCGGDFTMTSTSAIVPTGFSSLGGTGTATFNIGGNFVQAAGQGFITPTVLAFSALQPLTMNVGGNYLLSSTGGNLVFAQMSSTSNLNLNVGGNITMRGALSVFATVFGINSAGSGALNVVAGGDILIRRHAIIPLADDGSGTFIAGGNFTMENGSEITTSGTQGPNLQLTIVADNQFPSAPLIGPGGVNIDSGAIVFPIGTPGFPPIRIFTARRSQNNILGLINNTNFVAGPFDVNTPAEQWRVYYPQSFIGSPFTVFYKEPLFFPLVFTFLRLYAVLGNMYDVLSEHEYPLPFYKEQFCLYYCSEDPIVAKQECWSNYPPRRDYMIISNDSCYPVQQLNYRKFHPYRPKTLPMDID